MDSLKLGCISTEVGLELSLDPLCSHSSLSVPLVQNIYVALYYGLLCVRKSTEGQVSGLHHSYVLLWCLTLLETQTIISGC